VFFPHKKGNIV